MFTLSHIIRKISITFMLCILVLSPSVALTQGNLGNADDNLNSVRDKIGGEVEGDLNVIVGNIIKTVLSLIGLIFLLLTVYAGYLWMTARGNEENVTKAKEIFKSSIMGLFIVVSAYAITVFVTSRFGSQ